MRRLSLLTRILASWVLFVPSTVHAQVQDQAEADADVQEESLEYVHPIALIVTANRERYDADNSDVPVVGELLASKRIRAAVKEIIPGTWRVELRDKGQSPEARNVLREFGFHVDADQVVQFQSVVGDPLAVERFFEPTGLARRAGSTENVAFDLTRGDSQITVAVVDTSPDAYEDRLWSQGELMPPQQSMGRAGYSHGTSVSYTVFGQPNGTGSFGVCPGCTRTHFGIDFPAGTIGVGQLGALTTTLSSALDQLNRAIQSRPQVLNMSWGIPAGLPAFDTALESARFNGINMVAAAGNEALQIPLYPASSPMVLGVGSSGKQLGSLYVPWVRSDFSNRGADLLAPGDMVVVPNATAPTVSYYYNSGTSYSAPYVAGVLGLMRSYAIANPSNFGHVASLNPIAKARYFETLLLDSATDIEGPGKDHETGAGVVNAYAALRAMQEDAYAQNNQLAPGLTRSVSEWGVQRRIISALETRMESSTPRTEFIINNGPFSFGSCSSFPYAKLEVSRPRLSVTLRDTEFDLQTVNGDPDQIDVTIRTRIDYEGYVRAKIYPTVVECLLPLLAHSAKVNVTTSVGSAKHSFRFRYRLTTEGYKLESTDQVTPPTAMNISLEAFPPLNSTINHLVALMTRNFRRGWMAAVEDYLPAPLAGHLSYMVDRVLNASLAQERTTPFEHFRDRAGIDSSDGLDFAMAIAPVSSLDRSSHDLTANQTRTQVRVARPQAVATSAIQGSWSTPVVVHPAATGESEVLTHHVAYRAQLTQLFAKGAFDFRNHAELANAVVSSGTITAPGGVDFGFAGLHATSVPEIVHESPTSYDRGVMRMVSAFEGTISVGAVTTPAHIVYMVPLSRASQYKLKERETETKLVAGFYEERLVPDHTKAEIIIVPADAGFESAIVNQATLADIGEIFHFTYGFHVMRQLSALSAAQNHLNVMLGKTWGCLKDVSTFVNHYYRQYLKSQRLAETDLLAFKDQRGCYDLDIGYFAPSHTPEYTQYVASGAAATVTKLNFTERREIKEPRTAFGRPPTVEYSILNRGGYQYRAAMVRAEIVPLPDSDGGLVESQASIDGLIRTPFLDEGGNIKFSEEVILIEQLWQAYGSRGLREKPVILVPRINNSTRWFSVVGIGRNAEELARQQSCMPTIEVRFNYSGGATPTELRITNATLYREKTVLEPRDTWITHSCGSGSGSGSTGSEPGIVASDVIAAGIPGGGPRPPRNDPPHIPGQPGDLTGFSSTKPEQAG